MKVVKVTWIDSCGDDGRWILKSEVDQLKPKKCKTVGFLFEKTNKFVTIIQSVNNENIGARMSIPKIAIKKIKVLK